MRKFYLILLGISFFILNGCNTDTDCPDTFKLKSAHYYSATRLVAAIAEGQVTSLELLNHYLDRIEQYDGSINAIVAMNVDKARIRAKEADDAIQRGENWGPLHGLPMTIKDVFEVTGMPVTSGDPDLWDYLPEENAIAVQRLIDAGAIIFGKTNVCYHAMDWQSYNSIYGTTNNPWDLSCTPGGSSGGSAAALAAGFTPLELGSDLGGSIRLPSHFNGTFGHKPSFGIVPRYGHIPPMPGTMPPDLMPIIPLFVVGPMARNVEDLKLAFDILVTPVSSEDNMRKLVSPQRQEFKDYRVAVWLENPGVVDVEVLKELKAMVKVLRKSDLDIDETARPDFDIQDDILLYAAIIQYIQSNNFPESGLPPELLQQQKEHEEKWEAFFEDYDVLLTPVSPTAAFTHNQEGTMETRTLMINGFPAPYISNAYWATMAIVSGLPSTAVPIGNSESGLPIGVQIIGPKLEDKTTLNFACGLSKLMGGFSPPPNYE